MMQNGTPGPLSLPPQPAGLCGSQSTALAVNRRLGPAMAQPCLLSWLLLVQLAALRPWLPAWFRERGAVGHPSRWLGSQGKRHFKPSFTFSGFRFLFSWHSTVSCFREKTPRVLRPLFKKKKSLGRKMALTKQHVDELSTNESGTYGLNFPCSPQGLHN